MFDKASSQGAYAIEALERLSGSLSQGQQRELSKQISGAKKVLVMGLVEGTCLKTMNRSKLKEAVLDPYVQMQMGKIALVDSLMGDINRFDWRSGQPRQHDDGRGTQPDSGRQRAVVFRQEKL
ncbi:MAG: hypothetical protein CL927_19210 [Deltaproteobacteria bacterium]|nr:hypothetical protein [Deltaproteobacteria bacterium]HCH67004.1 hypothetical protein [Deltaproteobacteria bacterium]